MGEIVDLLRAERRARWFFLLLAQSVLGTGAGYVALLLIAFERFESPWAIGLVLLADVLPAMLLGPVFGAAADRWSRRNCMVVADALRLVAFGGIALVDGFAATVALAVLAGAGTGLFTPSALASLPSLLDDERRLPAATSLYGAVADLGFTAGPALAAGLLALADPETVLAVNAVSFGISALLLLALRFGAAPVRAAVESAPSLWREAREGMAVAARMPGLRAVLLASGMALFFGGVFNVAELPLATEALGASDVGFSAMVTLYGVGFIGGSLAGSKGGSLAHLKRRYLLGTVTMAAGFAGSGLAPVVPVALFTFAVAGVGNGLLLVYERQLIQALIPDELSGRIFGVKDALTAWAFALAFLAAPALIDAFDERAVVVAAGCGGLLVSLAALASLRNAWLGEEAAAGLAGRGGADVARDGRAREQRADVV
jgi:MFS family permease